MRREVRLGLLVLSAVLAFGCDSDDPLQITDQNAELSITATSAQVPNYNVWFLSEDSDNNGVPDDVNGDGVEGDRSLWCELSQSSPVATANSVPWTYSVRVEVLREGEIVAEQLTSTQAESDQFNRAAYDTSEATHSQGNPTINVVHRHGECSLNADIVCNPFGTSTICSRYNAGTCSQVFTCEDDPSIRCDPGNPQCPVGPCINDDVTRRMIFDNTTTRRRLSQANREVLTAGPNIITDACRGDAVCEAKVVADLGGAPLNPQLGQCPGPDLGNPALDPATPDANSDPLVFGFALEKGDTVIVQARRSDTIPGGGQIIQFLQVPGIRARLFIDGALLQADEVTGNASSPNTDPSPNISFSYTSK